LGIDSGSAYVFTRSGSSWAQSAKLTASDAAAGDDFGFSVAVSGDIAVVGAEYDDDAGSSSGSAYLFVPCGAGLYAGASACNACPAGSIAEVGAGRGVVTSGATTCTACAAGQVSSSATVACTECAAGQASSSSSTACASCGAGQFAAAGASACTICGTGQFAAAGASACTVCPAGSITEISVGTGAVSSGATTCSTCPVGEGNTLPSIQCCAIDPPTVPDLVTQACVVCPFPSRCDMFGCVNGSTGRGCAECERGHYQLGENCIPCSNTQMAIFVIGIVGAVTVIGVVWRLSSVGDSHFDYANDAANNAKSVAESISRNVAFMGIASLHLQISCINFGLHFDYPDWLADISKWIGSFVSFDLSLFSNPECSMPDDTETLTIISVRLLVANAGFILMLTILIGIGYCIRSKEHSINAGSALYTLSITALISTHAKALDCTDGHLDVLPSAACWSSTTLLYQVVGASGLALYCILIPLAYVRVIRKHVVEGSTHSPAFIKKFAWIVSAVWPAISR
jgi:hypothetical protein